MLDSDESELFDEAARTDPRLSAAAREMNCMAAAIAAACTTPLLPRTGQLERIHARVMEGRRPRRRLHPLVAYAGWGVAAALALLLVLRKAPEAEKPAVTASDKISQAPPPPPRTWATAPKSAGEEAAHAEEHPDHAKHEAARDVVSGLAKARTTTRAETRRLVQEIEVLRDNLERFQQRDRAVFETVPGRAWPIVMTMTPPGVPAEETQGLALADDPSRITTLLGDAITMSHRSAMGMEMLPPAADLQGPLTPGTARERDPGDAAPLPQYPSAIPIYDAARDTGTLVVNNLPATTRDEVYNLWVTTEKGGSPIFVGSLPVLSNETADSFDFSLGSSMVLPTGFLLTRDPILTPTRPGPENTVLQGPPTTISEE